MSRTSSEIATAAVRRGVAAVLLAAASVVSTATAMTLPSASAKPPTVSADSQEQADSSSACGAGRTVVVQGRTALSTVTICGDGRGHYEYRGLRLSDRAVLVLPARPMSNGCFGARSDAVDYTVSARKLLLTSGIRVLRDEPMTEFVDHRTPAAVVQRTGNVQTG